MTKIVLSYRRDDAKTITHWLYEKLVDRYGTAAIFRDIDSILPTENFRKRIGRELRDCDFIVAVVGPKWHGPLPDGPPRIHAANDWVRVEIETALQLDIPLLPVLVEDAEMPHAETLPASLRELTEINALPISSGGSRFYDDLQRLFATIESVTGIAPRELPVPIAEPVPPAAPAQTKPAAETIRESEPEPMPEERWALFAPKTLVCFLVAPAAITAVLAALTGWLLHDDQRGIHSEIPWLFPVTGGVFLGSSLLLPPALGALMKARARFRLSEATAFLVVTGGVCRAVFFATVRVQDGPSGRGILDFILSSSTILLIALGMAGFALTSAIESWRRARKSRRMRRQV